MNLTPQDIGEFQQLWKRETGQDIPPETAREYAEDILAIVALVVEKPP